MKMLQRIIITVAVVAVIMFMATSCMTFTGISGSGNVIREERKVEGFKGISASSGLNLFIKQGSNESLIIEAEDNIMPLIITEVKNDVLEIHYKLFSWGLSLTKPVNVYISVKELNEIKGSSGSSIKTEEIATGSIKINLSSSATGQFVLQATEIDANASSGALINISGKTYNQKINLSSGCSYEALDLISKSAVADVSSGASVKINVSDSLKVNISSGGLVQYKGTPKISSNISSGATLKNIN